MPFYPYKCTCGNEEDVFKSMDNASRVEYCECGEIMQRVITCPAITGTQDNFGIRKAFTDEETGKEINNWKDWEKHGYRDAKDMEKNPKVRENIKRKEKKIKNS